MSARFRGDAAGSEKEYGFCHRGTDGQLFVFEAPIDMLSFIQLFPKDWERRSYLSLGGTSARALTAFLSASPQTDSVFLCLDNDRAGNEACEQLAESAAECGRIIRLKPVLKDWNEILCRRDEIKGENPITETDGRVEKAIRQNKVRLLVIGPVQAFIGADVDMNRANEVRPIFRKLGLTAERTGCAIVLIGHLNKACGTQSTYRGLGSIDIAAAVRSLLFIGKVRQDSIDTLKPATLLSKFLQMRMR